MKGLYKNLITAFLFLFAFSSVFAAGGNRTGTGGAAELLIPVGARGIALGGASMAVSQGVEALYWNPAGVARMNNSFDATFSHMNYIADIGVEYGAISANVENFGVLSFSIKALSIGDIAITTTQDPDGTGATFSPQMLIAGLSYSRLLTENISVGITGNFVNEKLGDVSANGFAFDIGVVYNNLADISGLNFGVVIKNLGPQMQFTGSGLLLQAQNTGLNRPPQLYQANSAPFELPSTFEIGFAYSPKLDDFNSINFSGAYQNQNFSADEYKVGAEYSYNNTFFVRGGYVFAPDVDSDQFIYGFSAGAGINYDVSGLALRFDYAYRDVDFFEANHVFQVGLGF